MKALQFSVNVKGIYSYGRTVWQGKDRHVFDIALELMEQQRIKTESLVIHFFKLDEYCRMIEANINKKASQAIISPLSALSIMTGPGA